MFLCFRPRHRSGKRGDGDQERSHAPVRPPDSNPATAAAAAASSQELRKGQVLEGQTSPQAASSKQQTLPFTSLDAGGAAQLNQALTRVQALLQKFGELRQEGASLRSVQQALELITAEWPGSTARVHVACKDHALLLAMAPLVSSPAGRTESRLGKFGSCQNPDMLLPLLPPPLVAAADQLLVSLDQPGLAVSAALAAEDGCYSWFEQQDGGRDSCNSQQQPERSAPGGGQTNLPPADYEPYVAAGAQTIFSSVIKLSADEGGSGPVVAAAPAAAAVAVLTLAFPHHGGASPASAPHNELWGMYVRLLASGMGALFVGSLAPHYLMLAQELSDAASLDAAMAVAIRRLKELSGGAAARPLWFRVALAPPPPPAQGGFKVPTHVTLFDLPSEAPASHRSSSSAMVSARLSGALRLGKAPGDIGSTAASGCGAESNPGIGYETAASHTPAQSGPNAYDSTGCSSGPNASITGCSSGPNASITGGGSMPSNSGSYGPSYGFGSSVPSCPLPSSSASGALLLPPPLSSSSHAGGCSNLASGALLPLPPPSCSSSSGKVSGCGAGSGVLRTEVATPQTLLRHTMHKCQQVCVPDVQKLVNQGGLVAADIFGVHRARPPASVLLLPLVRAAASEDKRGGGGGRAGSCYGGVYCMSGVPTDFADVKQQLLEAVVEVLSPHLLAALEREPLATEHRECRARGAHSSVASTDRAARPTTTMLLEKVSAAHAAPTAFAKPACVETTADEAPPPSPHLLHIAATTGGRKGGGGGGGNSLTGRHGLVSTHKRGGASRLPTVLSLAHSHHCAHKRTSGASKASTPSSRGFMSRGSASAGVGGRAALVCHLRGSDAGGGGKSVFAGAGGDGVGGGGARLADEHDAKAPARHERGATAASAAAATDVAAAAAAAAQGDHMLVAAIGSRAMGGMAGGTAAATAADDDDGVTCTATGAASHGSGPTTRENRLRRSSTIVGSVLSAAMEDSAVDGAAVGAEAEELMLLPPLCGSGSSSSDTAGGPRDSARGMSTMTRADGGKAAVFTGTLATGLTDKIGMRRMISQHMPAYLNVSRLASLQLLGVLGKGGFGSVFLGTWNSMMVAIKFVQCTMPDACATTTTSSGDLKHAHEIAILSSVSHPNIIQAYAFLTDVQVADVVEVCERASSRELQEHADFQELLDMDVQCCHIEVLELCDLGSVSDALRRGTFRATTASSAPAAPAAATAECHSDPVLVETSRSPNTPRSPHTISCSPNASPRSVVVAAAAASACNAPAYNDVAAVLLSLVELASALGHLHSLGIVHCDIKPANVLLKSSSSDARGFTIKLADFGLARVQDAQCPTFPCNSWGTLAYVAPEALAHEAVDHSIDVYSFGILMYELYTNQRPYAGTPREDLLHAVVVLETRPIFAADVHPEYVRLASACWAAAPGDRPSFDVIVAKLNHMLMEETRNASEPNSPPPCSRILVEGGNEGGGDRHGRL